MTAVDDLWYLADTASQQAAQAYHRLTERYDEDTYLELTHDKRVSRRRFRTLARRIDRSGAPYGAHTLVHRPGELLLCWHDGVDLWVLPGGGVDHGETLRETARRELAEEAGMEVFYDGLAMLSRVEIRCPDHRTWGILPVYEARAGSEEPSVADPDGEITDTGWFPFDQLPADTRDRYDLLDWMERFGESQ
jgi:8-oxo-dGTP diphosphatase